MRGFQNLGQLVESQLGIRVSGPHPDLAGYEVKTLSAKEDVDRPLVVLFGMAPERLVPRSELVLRYSANGRTLDFGKLALGGGNERFHLTEDDESLLVTDSAGARLMIWRWEGIQDRFGSKLSKLVLLVAHPTSAPNFEIRSATVFLEAKPDAVRAAARGRNFRLRVCIQERSGRDSFEFSMRLPALRAIYER